MKKALLGIMAAAVILSLESTTALAAGPGCGRYYVDADGDGICDNYAVGQGRGRYYIDADGDGVCDNYAVGQGRGRYYIDADGDGICDNYTTGRAWCGGRGYGRGRCGR